MSFRRPFLRYLLPVLVAAVLLLAGNAWLMHFTRHDEKVRVPDLQGLSFEEALDLLHARGLQGEVMDSVYNDERPRATIVDQDPHAGWEVKPGRQVYLVMNASQPKMLNMPRLLDMSKRQAMSVMEILGLKVKELQYKPDPCVDCVIAQLHNGEPIEPEAKIRRGEPITLVLGSGMSGERVPVPDLRGRTSGEVRASLNTAGLNLGVVVECKGCNTSDDSTLARVYRQAPTPAMNNRIALGSMIDIWLTTDTAGLRPVATGVDSLPITGH